jgi:hypothetical protein
MSLAGHVVSMGGERKVYKVLVGMSKERDISEDRGVEGRMGLEWILRRLAEGGKMYSPA